MKAILQNFRNGDMEIANVPPPAVKPGGILVRNAASLVSAGTEKAVIELAKMNPLQKAKARPDLVRKVLNRAGQEGLLGTAQIVLNLVSTPLPLGYSCAGVVDAVGADVTDFHPGDRVACAGLGYANHAEVVFVPRNLATVIPAAVSFDDAAFVTVGAIALHGVRQAALTLGETVVVLGLGLVGQLTTQICAAAGCRVFGIDLDANKVKLARELGAEDGKLLQDADLKLAVRRFTRERGADAVLITAATHSSQPVELAAELARDRARVIAVGDVGLNIPRRAYYDKEIDVRLSRSYGPGRYDPAYEEQGRDYPLGYVRWTENRNMEAFLDLVACGKVRIAPLVTHRFPIERAQDAYALLTGEQREPYIGILLGYETNQAQPTLVTTQPPSVARASDTAARFAIIGAGQFAQGVLLPRLRSIPNVQIVGVANGSGLTARAVADKYKSRFCTSDYAEAIAQPDVNAVLIATRHNLHAQIVIDALAAGKHVFVEKPLAIRPAELDGIIRAYRDRGAPSRILMVGFNRRFSPLAVQLKQTFAGQSLIINYRVNAGFIPPTHWTQDPAVGGGRIVGEVCHFIDLMQFLTGAEPVEVFAHAMGGGVALPGDPDNLSAQIRFANGALGNLIYAANGDAGYPKEQVEVFGGGAVARIDNWRSLIVWKNGRRSARTHWLAAAKGHAEELAAFVNGVHQGESPISFESLLLTTQTTFAIQQSLRQGAAVPIVSPWAENVTD